MSLEATLFEQVNSTLGRIHELTVDMADAVNNALRWYPNPVRDWILDQWAKLVDLLERFWEWVKGIVENPGSPSTLRAVAKAWSDQVGGPVSGLEGYASRDYTDVNRYWEGEAADAYLEMLPVQQRAIAHISTTYSQPASSALDATATAIRSFWVAVVVALIVFVAGLIGGLALVATGYFAKAGILTAISVTLICIGAFITASFLLDNAMAGQNNTLLQKLNDNSGLRGEAWPT